MLKKLTTIGNDLGIVIERSILERLRIDRNTLLEVRTEGEALVIRPARETHRSRVRDATERMMASHERTLRKLAE